MKKLTNWILAGIVAVGAFLFGFLMRQPKINKLKDQVIILQNNNQSLQAFHQRNQEQFRDLLVQHKALKAYNFIKKSASEEKLKENLVMQYALKNYFDLLFKRIKHEQDLDENEIVFFNAYEKVIDGRKISASDMVKIKDFIFKRHSDELNSFTECDCTAVFEELKGLSLSS